MQSTAPTEPGRPVSAAFFSGESKNNDVKVTQRQKIFMKSSISMRKKASSSAAPANKANGASRSTQVDVLPAEDYARMLSEVERPAK